MPGPRSAWALAASAAASTAVYVAWRKISRRRRQRQKRELYKNDLWTNRLLGEAAEMHAIEPAMDCLLRATVLGGEIASFEDAVAACLAHRLGCRTACGTALLFEKLRGDVASVADAVRADADAVLDRDPACQTSLEVLLYFKGFAALQAHRVAEVCWHRGERGFALWLQSRASEVCGVDIHPAARIGQGVMLDHGTGVVVGETARVGDGGDARTRTLPRHGESGARRRGVARFGSVLRVGGHLALLCNAWRFSFRLRRRGHSVSGRAHRVCVLRPPRTKSLQRRRPRP
mmetsp:Transcript_18205/g.61388  ORF Transcript_18205/g.61388 Transcript_18205/m.61388 type:complete len:289 (+) Transcript_18205:40-906(+)